MNTAIVLEYGVNIAIVLAILAILALLIKNKRK
jgi:hypothetical protein